MIRKCHENCTEIRIPIFHLGDPRIKKCKVIRWWFFGYNCRSCGCSYKEHNHSNEDTKLIERTFVNYGVKEKLEKCSSAREAKKIIIENIEHLVKELNQKKKKKKKRFHLTSFGKVHFVHQDQCYCSL